MILGTIYLIGSLRNPRVAEIANELRSYGFDVFDDWLSPGPTTDEDWQRYEKARGRSFKDALRGEHALTQFRFDKENLDKAQMAVLVLPAGKSAHMELGYMIGTGKPGFIFLDGEPERYDLMYAFATSVCDDVKDLCMEMHRSV